MIFLAKLLDNQTARWLFQLFFLILFGFLALQGTIQVWLFILLAGIILSPFWGRVFCGWVCPMCTVFRGINWVYKKLSLDRLTWPSFLQKRGIRWFILILFVGIMIIGRRAGVELDMLLYVFALSIVFTLFFREPFWHRNVCPYGAPLSLAGKTARNHLEVNKDKCTGCGLCDRVCPSMAISETNRGKREIDPAECLVCGQCKKVCPTGAIDWNGYMTDNTTA